MIPAAFLGKVGVSLERGTRVGVVGSGGEADASFAGLDCEPELNGPVPWNCRSARADQHTGLVCPERSLRVQIVLF